MGSLFSHFLKKRLEPMSLEREVYAYPGAPIHAISINIMQQLYVVHILNI